jgi:hypothetical protein
LVNSEKRRTILMRGSIEAVMLSSRLLICADHPSTIALKTVSSG